MEPTNQPLTGSAFKRELARKSNDRIRVYNPLEYEWVVYWDGFGFKVPPKGTSVFPRYIALNYAKHIIDHILTKESDRRAKELDEERIGKGMKAQTPDERYNTDLRISDPTLRSYWLKEIWLGLETEYGTDVPERITVKPRDDRDFDEKFLGDLEKQVFENKQEEGYNPAQPKAVDNIIRNIESKPEVSETETPQSIEKTDYSSMSPFVLRKLLKEKGISVPRTAKKLEMIEKLNG